MALVVSNSTIKPHLIGFKFPKMIRYISNMKKTTPEVKESLFERVKKIENINTTYDKGPMANLFPNTLKRSQPYVDPNQRCGALGIKLGLTHLWFSNTVKQVLCTMIHIDDCKVLQHVISKHPTNGQTKHTMIVGMGTATEEDQLYFHPQTLNYYEYLGIQPKLTYRGFHVHPNHILRAGMVIKAMHFSVGQRLKISSITKDRGFLGAMQRWDFAGTPGSHGVSKYHRGRGSICNLNTRVHPDTKMAGHTGLQRRFVNGPRILRINTKFNVIYVQGTIPGPIGQIITMRDWWNHPKDVKIHFPTFTDPIENIPEEIFAPNIHNPSTKMEPSTKKPTRK